MGGFSDYIPVFRLLQDVILHQRYYLSIKIRRESPPFGGSPLPPVQQKNPRAERRTLNKRGPRRAPSHSGE